MERCVIEFERNDSIHDSKKKYHGLFLAYFGFVTDQDSRIIYFINHREYFFFYIERASLRTYSILYLLLPRPLLLSPLPVSCNDDT